MTVLLPAINNRLRPNAKTTASAREIWNFLVFVTDGLLRGSVFKRPLSPSGYGWSFPGYPGGIRMAAVWMSSCLKGLTNRRKDFSLDNLKPWVWVDRR